MTHDSSAPRVRNLTSARRISEAESLVLQLIHEKYRPLPLADSLLVPEAMAGVAGVLDDGTMIGVVHWSADVDDQLELEEQGGAAVSAALGREVRVLQNIAVDPRRSREGIGSALIQHLLDMARRDGIKTVIGVATGGSGPFFASNGFTVLDPGQTLPLKLYSVKTILPLEIDPPSCWFYLDL